MAFLKIVQIWTTLKLRNGLLYCLKVPGILFFLICAALFGGEGISEAGSYRSNSQYQWEAAIESLAQVEFSQNDQVLDVGCGDGKITAMIAEKVDRIIGIDISSAMIEDATLHHSQSNLLFLQTSATEIPFKERFDKVVSFNALHWVVEQKEALRSIYDSLKENGTILLLFPAHNPYNLGVLAEKMVKSEKWSDHFPNFRKVRVYYTPEEYAHLLQEAGFQILSIESIENPLRFQDRERFIAWLSPLINFTDHLSPAVQKDFIEEFADQMIVKSGGMVSVPSTQLKVTAIK